MNTSFAVGLLGALILVIGAAWPERPVRHPTLAIKNWLFAVGNLCMFAYALLNWVSGGSIFFVILQIFINATSILMMLNTKNSFDIPFVALVGSALTVWALSLFEGYGTVLFVIGLSSIGLGFALDTNTVQRNIALTTGSIIIAFFSYLQSDWVFFWLNVFFALFSAYYAWKLSKKLF
ncbi:hypothetical protein A2635_00980 [Candidatus Peribacteria bacterium RIFCSPHIGHO2_01_FULL_51_9]|nr:MAG: hypothetical protein A2635_00980 [Candidatus Peribacteria bacterium RIFCSPHIGHO2_01_FULL_51_9]